MVLRRKGPSRTCPGYQSERSPGRVPGVGYTPPRPMGRRAPRARQPGHLGGLSSMAEHRIVAPKVAGSSPVGHPKSPPRTGRTRDTGSTRLDHRPWLRRPSPGDRVRGGRPRGRGRRRLAGPRRGAQRPPLPHRRRQRRAPGGRPRRQPARGRTGRRAPGRGRRAVRVRPHADHVDQGPRPRAGARRGRLRPRRSARRPPRRAPVDDLPGHDHRPLPRGHRGVRARRRARTSTSPSRPSA